MDKSLKHNKSDPKLAAASIQIEDIMVTQESKTQTEKTDIISIIYRIQYNGIGQEVELWVSEPRDKKVLVKSMMFLVTILEYCLVIICVNGVNNFKYSRNAENLPRGQVLNILKHTNDKCKSDRKVNQLQYGDHFIIYMYINKQIL